MAGLADELMKAFSAHDNGALKMIEQRKRELTDTVARDLRARFTQALSAQDPRTAFAASMLASGVYLQIGNRREALRALFDNIQIRFMMADNASAYEAVRKAALDCTSKAHDIDARDLAFFAALTAADCSYFASEASQQTSSAGRRWLKTCLDDLEIAAPLVSGDAEKTWLPKLASLMAQATRDAQSLLWSDEKDTVDAQLRRLAAATEQAVPVALQFPGDVQRTRTIGQALAELSYRYGTIDHADARIAWLTKTLS